MAKALGIGGVFFKSAKPVELAEWYRKWLGMELEMPAVMSFKPDTIPPGGMTVWSPFKADTTYFDPSPATFMINLMVDDLDGALAQVKEGGATIVGEIQSEPYGRFGWFLDPDGNKVELWEPKPWEG